MEWIRVEDKLPDEHETVQAWSNEGTWFPRAWRAWCGDKLHWCYGNVPDSEGWNWIDGNSGFNCEITHWMPLPEPPH